MLKDQEASLTKYSPFFFTKDLAMTRIAAWKRDCSYHAANPFDFLTQEESFSELRPALSVLRS
jgi:hypothetical protein